MRRALLVLVLGCRSLPAPEEAPLFVNDRSHVLHEFRGVWIATVFNLDWPSRPGLPAERQQQELVRILDRAVALKLNAVILQVRPNCDALYPSELEPWSVVLGGVQGQPPQPLYDPLALAVEQAHARGLELHAWFNPYRAGRVATRERMAANHVARARPELVREYGNDLWLDPGLDEVRAHTRDVVLDVVRRYDIDGVHMDDYFYPYPVAGVDFPDEVGWQRYRDGGGALARDDWRRDNVDRLVRELGEAIKRERPQVKFGVSPFGIWKAGHPAGVVGLSQYHAIYADPRRWLREGWVDYLAPQLYWRLGSRGQPFEPLLTWWRDENVRGRHVWPGLHTEKFAAEGLEIPQQIATARRLLGSGAGHIHFPARVLLQDAGATAVQPAYDRPALQPEMPWLGPPPAPPRGAITATDDRAVEVTVDPASLAGASVWVLQVRRGARWDYDVIPAGRARVSLPMPGPAAPEAFIFAVSRGGSHSERIRLNPVSW